MINCVIIEDEFAGQDILTEKLERLFPAISIVAIIEKKSEAIQFLNENEVQLVFMDAEIKGGTGISILDQVHSVCFSTVFTTAHEKYAIQAINRGVSYYLLKPFSDTEFVKAVNTGLSKIDNTSRNDCINIATAKGTNRVLLEDIIYFKSDGPYTEIYTTENKYFSTKNLGFYESRLIEKAFFRCHNSYLINVSKVKLLNKGRNGSVELENNEQIPISQRRRSDFLKFIAKN